MTDEMKLIGMIKLYGICSKEQVQSLIGKLPQELPEGVVEAGDFYVEELLFYDQEEYKRILELARGKGLYVPEDTLLERYANFGCDTELPAFVAFKNCIRESFEVPMVDAIALQVGTACTEDRSLQAILNILGENGIQIQTQEQFDGVLKYLIALSNSSRKWINGGFTPEELHLKENNPSDNLK